MINACGLQRSALWVLLVLGMAWPDWAGDGATHPLLSRLCDVPVRLEKAAQVDCLAAPEVSVDTPVKRKLQRLPVKAPVGGSVSAGVGRRAGGRRTGRASWSSWRRRPFQSSAWRKGYV